MTNYQNYFHLFDLAVMLPIDEAKLTFEYQQLQRKYHPDNFAACPESKRLDMLKQSATINHAYQILKDPINSADYLLSLNGVLSNAEQNIINDHDFLTEQFELRAQLDRIESLPNNSEKQHALFEFSSQINNKWEYTYTSLLRIMNESNWLTAVSYVNKLRFLKKLQQDIERVEDQLFDVNIGKSQ